MDEQMAATFAGLSASKMSWCKNSKNGSALDSSASAEAIQGV
jgi:hypothetical protein